VPLPVAILAGGLGTRMYPRTRSVPKALLEVAGEPFVAHQLRRLAAGGYERIVILTGYLGEMIEEFVGDGARFGVQVSYVADGDVPLGTAGAVVKALPLLGAAFMLTFGDAYLRVDYGDVEQAFHARGTDGLMTIFRPAAGDEAPNAAAADGFVRAYEKKAALPGLEYVDYGLSVFRSRAFAELPPGQAADLTSVNQMLIARGELAAYVVEHRPYEIGSPHGLEQTEHFLTHSGYANE